MNKTNTQNKKLSGSLSAKLAAYSGVAAAFIAFSPDANAQCAAESVTPNVPGNFENGTVTQIDFDGDGVVDFLIGSYNLVTNSSTQICNVDGPTPGDNTYVNATCGTVQLSYSIKQYYDQQGTFAFNSVYMDPYANLAITVPVGTSGSVCAGAGVATACGIYGLYSSYANSVVIANSVVQSMLFDTATPPCFVSTNIVSSNPGPVGPVMTASFQSNPGDGNFAAGQNHFIGIEFLAGDGNRYPGWIEVMVSDAGTISVVNTGYNPTVGGCIAVGSCETTAACINDLGLSAGSCDDAGTTGDAIETNDDDTFDLTINPVGDNTTGNYTVSGDITANGTYGTPLVITGLPADGATLNITVVSNDNPTCTLTQQVTAPNACSFVSQDVPTVGEWGLIILALMMSITGVVGIRNSKEREVQKEYS